MCSHVFFVFTALINPNSYKGENSDTQQALTFQSQQYTH